MDDDLYPDIVKVVLEDQELSIEEFLACYSHKPLLLPQEPSPILVSIDFEAYERDQSKITEIGIAVLDLGKVSATTDTKVKLSQWFQATEYAHYKILEHQRLKNKTWVKGCPDNFQFGESRIISKHKAAMLLGNVVQAPNQLHRANSSKFTIVPTNAKVIIIGHDFGSDAKYSSTLGYDFPQLPEIDTRNVRGMPRKQGPGLGRLLNALGIESSYLHNAGNDAAYTLKAAIVMAMKETETPGMTAFLIRADH